MNMTMVFSPPDEYACEDSKDCIPETWTCDEYQDCPGGDDERNCHGPTEESSTESDGKFTEYYSDIQSEAYPSSSPDCADLGRGFYSCPSDRTHCVHKKQICDGHVDCPGKLQHSTLITYQNAVYENPDMM
jgi:hypothetical protein